MKLIAALGLTLSLGSLTTIATAQSQPPAPTEAAPTPEPAPVMGQEAPPPPTTEGEPEFTPPPQEPVAEQAPPPEAPEEEAPKRKRDAGPFARGSVTLTLLVGTASLGYDSQYVILGGGLGYYVVDGLELGAEGTIWLFDSPTIGTVMPQARYVLHMVPVIKPYVGTFFKHYMVGEDIDDFNSVGGKVGGLLVMAQGRAYLGLGAVYEHLLDCDDTYFSCDDWYPELSIALSF